MSEGSVAPRRGLILAVVAFGVFVAADDLTVVSTMLRQIIFDLEIPLPDGLDQAAWIVNAYLIAYVVVMPIMGRVSDLVGRRPVYVASLALFLLGSIWVPLAPDLPSFIVGRVLTALGGGALVPVGMAIIGDLYGRDRRASALGILGAVDTAGWVWGPLYGALLVRYLNWRWQFYLNIPLSLLGILAALWVLRDLPVSSRRGRLDWAGAAALLVALVSINVALLERSDIQSVTSLMQLQSEPSGGMLPLLAIGLLGTLVFVWLQRRQSEPLLDLGLFRRRNFSPAIGVNFLMGSVLIIAMVNVPLFVNVLELELAQAAVRSGLLLSALTAAMAVAAYVGGLATERLGYRFVTVTGVAVCAVAFALMGRSWSVETPYAEMALQLALLGGGFGLVIAPIGAAVINAAPAPERGIAASLVILFRLMGMSVGLSALTGWGIYRFNILRRQVELPPLSDPSFASALAEGLTGTTARVLAETFWMSAAIAVLAFVLALWLRAPATAGDQA